MSFLTLMEVIGGYVTVGVILALAVLTAWVNHYGGDALCLLDGTPLRSVLDDRDRARMVIAHSEADRAPDLFAFALEEIRNLPERAHP